VADAKVSSTPGKKALAMEAFARVSPRTQRNASRAKPCVITIHGCTHGAASLERGF
jgi:hypothetical protein